MSKNNFLTIREVKQPISFLFAWHIAREHYVMARVSFMQGMVYPSCLLAEQSVELFIKAILHLDNKSKGTHYLPDLLKRGKAKIGYFDLLLTDERLKVFIESLSLAYGKMRFGEAGFDINTKELCFALDEVAYSLDRLYQTTAQPHIVQRVRAVQKDGVTTQSYEKQKCLLYVPTALKEAFLRDNKFFNEDAISDNFMASVPMP
jgi:HEPN domain-containing protein